MPTMVDACLAMLTVRLVPEPMTIVSRALLINLFWSVVLALAIALLVNTKLPLVVALIVLLTVLLVPIWLPIVSPVLLPLLSWTVTTV